MIFPVMLNDDEHLDVQAKHSAEKIVNIFDKLTHLDYTNINFSKWNLIDIKLFMEKVIHYVKLFYQNSDYEIVIDDDTVKTSCFCIKEKIINYIVFVHKEKEKNDNDNDNENEKNLYHIVHNVHC